MKTHSNKIRKERQAGVLLVECVVYIAVFAVLFGLGTSAFYACWNYSKALRYTTDDVSAALRAGEEWRADVRAAHGTIAVEKMTTGETVTLREAEQTVIYRVANGELRREIAGQDASRLLLSRVKLSRMQADPRDGVTAWRWDLELAARRTQLQLPLAFTFEAVPKL